MDRLRGQAQQRGEARVPGHQAAFGVERAQAVVDAVEHRAQQAPLLRNVRTHPPHRQRVVAEHVECTDERTDLVVAP
ncbi:hypothetical protein D9M68_853230 [compost metagenome]